MNDDSDSIKEVAKTAGKVTDATRELGRFIERYTGGTIAEAIGIIEDKLKYLRWERQIRLMETANRFLEERGLKAPTREVPLNLAVPILQAGSLEGNDALQDRYAALLASAADAASDFEVRRAFVSILEDLTPLDVDVLETIYRHGNETRGFWTTQLPERVSLERPEGDVLPPPDVQISVMNLIRLGLLASEVMTPSSAAVSCVSKTPLGRAFFQACST